MTNVTTLQTRVRGFWRTARLAFWTSAWSSGLVLFLRSHAPSQITKYEHQEEKIDQMAAQTQTGCYPWDAERLPHLLCLTSKSTVVPSMLGEPAAAGPLLWATYQEQFITKAFSQSILQSTWCLGAEAACTKVPSLLFCFWSHSSPTWAGLFWPWTLDTQFQVTLRKSQIWTVCPFKTEGFTAGTPESYSLWVRPRSTPLRSPWNNLPWLMPSESQAMAPASAGNAFFTLGITNTVWLCGPVLCRWKSVMVGQLSYTSELLNMRLSVNMLVLQSPMQCEWLCLLGCWLQGSKVAGPHLLGIQCGIWCRVILLIWTSYHSQSKVLSVETQWLGREEMAGLLVSDTGRGSGGQIMAMQKPRYRANG